MDLFSTDDSPFHDFPMHSQAFLSRATEYVDAFEVRGDVAAFFHAALHLRFGIEARLNEYIRAALESLGRPMERSSQFAATDLLARLKKIDPNANRESFLRAVKPGTSEILYEARFTPVSKRLAGIHGQLGELLHHKFFLNNPNWHMKGSLAGGSQKSLSDYTPLLREGLTELAQANSGSLLTTPFFSLLVAEALDAQDDQPSAGDDA